ncbi:MAG: hypothetical protein C4326_01355 [Ignavibacteria bacterium]
MNTKAIVTTGLAAFWVLMGIGTLKPGRIDSPVSLGDEDNPRARDEMEFLIQRDPATNTIPRDIYRRERQFANRIPTREEAALQKGMGVQELVWVERGPNNVGGRSRVLAADVANVGTLIAGSVAGGIWKTTNDGASWRLTLSPSQIHTTSCIAQDVRPGKTHIWYVGTGEFRGSTTNNTRWGAFYRGDGIYKSTDNGESWTLLPSTSSGTPQQTDAFDYVWNVAVNPANLVQDEVYAATWNGVYRSTNGGTSWVMVQPSDSGLVNTAGFSTDVAITSTGVVYAHTKQGGTPKIWRSPEGVTWTDIKPSTFPTSTGRIVFGIAPSNPNVVYVFVESANNMPATAGHQLWKYTHSTSGGTWENRGGNLPSDLSTQTGYDQLVQVKPDDENFVLIGGTNLYCSTNGFASTAATTTIGGYPFWPNGNHHPDLHSGAFRPGNPNVYYSGHDGGISRADDIRLPSMVWTSLNNGYNVTQFYSVAIGPDSGDNAIVAGAQDNGSQATNQPGLSAWTMVSSGDGTVVEMAPLAHDRMYTQSQNGPLYKISRAGAYIGSMQPSGSTRALFVNPIALDPNDPRILYYGAGKSTAPTVWSGLWRNSNAPSGTSTVGWTALTATDVGTPSGWTRAVSCIGISKANSPNVVYFGTTDGIVKRVDSANSTSPLVTDVTPPGLNGGTAQGGFVRCIAVDPTNSQKALVAFGNYNFQNLWYTTNGGQTWTDVEGNLAGPDGPSIRWAVMFFIGNQLNIYLATSIGVLMTDNLNGSSTIWTQAAATAIGNILIGYLDYRASDRTLAAGTHARGVFTTQLPSGPTSVDAQAGHPAEFRLHQNFPNPFSAAGSDVVGGNASTTIAFTLGRASFVSLKVFDVAGREVGTLLEQNMAAGTHAHTFRAHHLAAGVYLYRLSAGGVTQTRKMVVVR